MRVGPKMYLFLINLIFLFGTGEVGALLPVVGTLLQFSPDEVNSVYSHGSLFLLLMQCRLLLCSFLVLIWLFLHDYDILHKGF